MSGRGSDALAWAKAKELLEEASRLDPETNPVTLVHASYYAMFHAARACLLRERQSSPKTHGSVIQQLGDLVRNEGDELREAGRSLNRIADLRNKADYDEMARVPPELAAAALRSATRFLALCGARFGLDDT